ncbi:MAG: alpha/beta hydrolase [Planctomycetota bacterium]
MPFIQTRDGHSLFVKHWGDRVSPGPTVVLIHGWPLCSDSFDHLALHLSLAGYRVLAYDRRGFGRSDQPFDGYTYDTLSDDLADVMGSSGVDDAVLIGFSMGGGEVVRYASRHGGKHMVAAGLIGSVTPFLLKTDDHPEGVDGSVFESMKDGIRADRAAFFAGFFKNFYGVTDDNAAVSQPCLQWTRQMAMRAGLKATLDCVDAFGRTDFRDDLKAIGVPTLILHGTEDLAVPIEISGDQTAKQIADADVIRYDGGPHGLLVTHQDEVAGDVLNFLSTLN